MAPTARRPAKRRAVGLLGIRQANSSDDEDYAPAGYRSPAGASRPASAAAYPPSPVADEDVPLAQRRRQLHAQQQPQQQQPKPAAAAGSGSGGTPPARTPGLPDEVLCLILRKACDPANGGAIPTAAAATCVCRAWRAAALSCPNLWQHIDLTWPRCRPTDAALARITPRWSGLRSLKLAPGAAGTGGMSGASLQLVAARCPVLTTLSLAHCSQFGEAALCAALTEMLLRPAAADRSSAPLTHLDLSFSEVSRHGCGMLGLVAVYYVTLAQHMPCCKHLPRCAAIPLLPADGLPVAHPFGCDCLHRTALLCCRRLRPKYQGWIPLLGRCWHSRPGTAADRSCRCGQGMAAQLSSLAFEGVMQLWHCGHCSDSEICGRCIGQEPPPCFCHRSGKSAELTVWFQLAAGPLPALALHHPLLAGNACGRLPRVVASRPARCD
jgi:hypothetical protein